MSITDFSVIKVAYGKNEAYFNYDNGLVVKTLKEASLLTADEVKVFKERNHLLALEAQLKSQCITLTQDYSLNASVSITVENIVTRHVSDLSIECKLYLIVAEIEPGKFKYLNIGTELGTVYYLTDCISSASVFKDDPTETVLQNNKIKSLYEVYGYDLNNVTFEVKYLVEI